jgi:Rod binding domain-containing protein
MSSLPPPGLSPAMMMALGGASKAPAAAAALASKTRAAAEEFEAVFLNTMFQQLFANVGQGPFNGGPAAGVWRSFLTDEYAKSFAKAGGIGLADHVHRSLLALQEVR